MSNGATIRTHTVSKTLSVPLRFIDLKLHLDYDLTVEESAIIRPKLFSRRAQELMSTVSDAYSGFLAKRGRRERIVERFNLPNKPIFNDIKKWRRRFIIVSQGCVYIYDKETSSRPHQSFPLYGYNRLQAKMGSDHGAFTFKIEGKKGGGFKMYYFATETDEERKAWMTELRSVMCIANDTESDRSPSDVRSLSDQEAYDYLQKPVIEDDDEDCDSNDSDYDRIEDEILQQHRTAHRPLPTVPEEPKGSRTLPSSTRDIRSSPKHTSVNGGRRVVPPIPEDSVSSGSLPQKATKTPRKKPEPPAGSNPKPPAASKPKPPGASNPGANYVDRDKSLKEKDYMYDGADREEVKKILLKGQDGTFLVRKSRTDDSNVLAVKTGEEVKEYKIFGQNSKVTLDRKDYYNSMQDLVKHYKEAKLPKRDTTLGKAYSTVDISDI